MDTAHGTATIALLEVQEAEGFHAVLCRRDHTMSGVGTSGWNG